MRRRMIIWLVASGLVLALIGLVVLVFTQARLVWEPLTPHELEALRQAVRSEPQPEMSFHGAEGVLDSRWNWISSKLFPGVLLEEPLLLYAHRARGVQLLAEAPPMQPPERGLRFPSFRGVADRLEVGGLVLERVPTRVVAARHRLKALGVPLFQVEGFLGISFLKRFAATWDLEHHRLYLQRYPVERSGPGISLHQAEFESEGERIRYYYVDGFIDGQGPYRTLIDTGASVPVLMVISRIAQVHGAGQEQFRVRHLQLGDIELEDLPTIDIQALLGRKEFPKEAGAEMEIILGTSLLRAQGFKRLTLDFLAGKLYLER